MGNHRRNASFAFGVAAALVALTGAAFACTAIQGKMVLSVGTTQSQTVGEPSNSHAYCSVTGGAQGTSGDSFTVTVSAYANAGAGDPCASTQLAGSADAAGGPAWVKNADCFSPLDGTTPLPVCKLTNRPYYTWQGKGYGDYEVRFQSTGTFTVSGTTYTHTPFASPSCIDGNASSYTVLSTSGSGLTVAANGSGTWTGNLPTGLTASGPTDSGAICIYATRSSQPAPSDMWADIYGPGYYQDQPTAQSNQAPIVVI